MTVPDRPVFVKQLDGSRYAGLNCTCASGAMALDRWTIGAKKATGAYIRFQTGDTVGGTTLAQVRDAIHRVWGYELDVRYGLDWDVFSSRIESGQGAILQGWAGVTRGTKWQGSETFGGNHAWFVNDRDGDNFHVYDPLADGRRPGIAKSPMRIPASVVREFAGRLNIAGPEGGYDALGLGKVYAAFTRDTEPHVHLRGTARRTSPFPDRTHANQARVAVRHSPSATGKLVKYLSLGDLFTAYQQTDTWLGNHSGTAWVRKSQMRGIGGTR